MQALNKGPPMALKTAELLFQYVFINFVLQHWHQQNRSRVLSMADHAKKKKFDILSRISNLLVPVRFLVHRPLLVALVKCDIGCTGSNEGFKHNEVRSQSAQQHLQLSAKQANLQRCPTTWDTTYDIHHYLKFLISLVQ